MEDDNQKTFVEVRNALKHYAVLNGREAARELLRSHGAATINELGEDRYDAVIAEALSE